MSKYSVMYNYVRSRQLEETFPGDPTTGCWPITSLRVMRGWGCPPEEAWPHDGDANHWPPKVEPENIDLLSREERLFAYQRVRSCDECKIALSNKIPVFFATEITASWFQAPNGLIPVPGPGDEIIGSHSVILVGYDDNKGTFEIKNSWGTDWGDEGYGYLPYEAVDKFIVESWIDLPHENYEYQKGKNEGIQIINWGIPSYLHDLVHGIEIRGCNNDYMAWAFAIPYDHFLNVEELFVMPAYRGQGLSKTLFGDLRALSEKLGKSLRFWVPFADSAEPNVKILRHLVKKYRYKIYPAGVRWASFIIGEEELKGGKKQKFPIPGIVPPGIRIIPVLSHQK